MYNKDRIMRKLLGKPAAEPSPVDGTTNNSAHGATSSPLGAAYRPSASQDVSYNAGVPIGCLDKSPDGRGAILAGRHILKTIKLDGVAIQDGVDVRAAITSQTTARGSTTSVADQLSIKAVKWASGRGDTAIFTACANGKIFQYDLTRLGLGVDGGPMEVIHMREDSRQMNTLDVNPHRGSYLLAGSQDGIVRCFDIRTPVRTQTGHLTFRAVQAFKSNADGVRHLQWSPKDGFAFACGTEQGVVQKWDIRNHKSPMLRINGHDKACAVLAWHPDGDHLISGGWDHKCHVWDVSPTADKRQKPKWTISTPAPVAAIAWRPGTWSATAQGKRIAQVAVTYDDGSQTRHGINACHIWDLARPTMPFKELRKFDTCPAGLLWHDQDLLWTAGPDGLFNQFDVVYAPKVIDRVAMSTFAFSSRGEVLLFSDERPQGRRPHRPTAPAEMVPPSPYSTGPGKPMLSISRSDSEDDVAADFLGARRNKPKHRRTTTGSRSVHSLSTTPPGAPDDHMLALDQSLKVTGIFRPLQGMAIGPVPSASKVNVYDYLSAHYLHALHKILPYKKNRPPLNERVGQICEHYAIAAETVGRFRLAQTWRILAYGINMYLSRRAQYHFDRRTGELQRSEKLNQKQKNGPTKYDSAREPLIQLTTAEPHPMDETSSKGGGASASVQTVTPGTLRSLLSEEIESTSNVATPLARPVDSSDQRTEQQFSEADDRLFAQARKLSPVQEGEGFALGPPARSFPPPRRRLDSEPLSTFSHDSDTQASTDGYDFYDTDSISKAIDVPAPKGQFNQDVPTARSPSELRNAMARHNSDETSDPMFSISTGSRRNSALTGSSTGSMVRRSSSVTSAPRARLARSTSGGEFESRIRGAKIQESPEGRHALSASPAPISLQRTETQLTEEEYPMITQTTMDSVDSRKGESHPKPDSYPQETPRTGSYEPSALNSFEADENNEPEQPKETDYLPWPGDPPYPQPVAWEHDGPVLSNIIDPCKLVSRALSFETKSSALNASAMIMLLQPLIKDDSVINPFQAAAILKQHHARLMDMKLFTQAALLRKLCVRGWPGKPLSEWGENYPSVFRLGQERVNVGLLCPRCHKPREIDRRRSHKKNYKNPIWRCERCSAVMDPCAVCKHYDVPEPCSEVMEISADLVQNRSNAKDATVEPEPILATWWYCAGCGHGGHATCIQEWHSGTTDDGPSDDGDGLYSDGCCPLDGCGHACLPGKYRAEAAVARTEEVSRAVREATRGSVSGQAGGPSLRYGQKGTILPPDEGIGLGSRGGRRGGTGPGGSLDGGVHGDGHEVPQSRAVESVRESLAGHGGHGHGHSYSAGGGSGRTSLSAGHDGFGGGILSSSPGRIGGGEREFPARERRKSVKFAGTMEDRR